jgi:hypothetical protein
MSTATQFDVRIHEKERIVEVIYPARVTAEAIAEYAERIRQAAAQLNGPWRCLVDQRQLDVIPPDLTDAIAEMNRWALQNGLVGAARVVNRTAIGELQSRRILRESGLTESSDVYFEPSEAWNSLLAANQLSMHGSPNGQ